MKNYFDVYYRPGDAPVFCYRSGLAVYEETFYNGVLTASGYNAAGYPLDVLSNYPTRIDPRTFHEPSVFGIDLDGQGIDRSLSFVSFTTERTDASLDAVLTLESRIKPARVHLHTVLDGTQMFTRYIEIENLSDQSLCLSRLVVLGGGIETMDRAQLTNKSDVSKLYSVGYFDDDNWGREGDFAWHDLTPGAHCIDTRFGRDRFRHPLVFIRNNITGTMFFSQIGWTGGCRFTVDHNAVAERERSSLSLKAEITSFSPLTVIEPREVFRTPEVHMGVIAGGLDDAVNEMHDHIRRSVLCMPELNPVDLSVGAGMGAEHDMTVETSKSFMRQFAEMGAEMFIIDAGWECPLGSPIEWGAYNGVNDPNPERYPNGIDELSDYCHSLGMKFALWIEIERLGEKCGAWTEHPDWVANTIFGNRNGGFLDMSNPEAARWAEEELARMISEYKLDMLRIDNNVSYKEYFAFRERIPGKSECLSLRHFNGVYKLYENLKRRFPNVIFENCAGGGGRTDLGMMRYFNHTWVSDWQKAPRSVLITNGMTMALPPERVDRLFAGMGCHGFGSFDLQMRNTMLGHMSLNVVAPTAAQPNPVQMEFIRHSVDIYKKFIRGILPTARIFHHTPEALKALDSGFCAIEISSPDGKRGALGAFTLTGAKNDSFAVIPRGINPGKSYRVTLDNSGAVFSVSGYELSVSGLRLSIPASMSSELVLYEEA